MTAVWTSCSISLLSQSMTESTPQHLNRKSSSLGVTPRGSQGQNQKGWGRLFSKRKQSPQKTRPGGSQGANQVSSPPKQIAAPPGEILKRKAATAGLLCLHRHQKYRRFCLWKDTMIITLWASNAFSSQARAFKMIIHCRVSKPYGA